MTHTRSRTIVAVVGITISLAAIIAIPVPHLFARQMQSSITSGVVRFKVPEGEVPMYVLSDRDGTDVYEVVGFVRFEPVEINK